MPRVNVWIPDSLYTQAKEAGINVSAAAQYGISVKLGNAETIRASARQPDGDDSRLLPDGPPLNECRHPKEFRRTGASGLRFCGICEARL